MDQPLISIVIPVKNGDKWIESCLYAIMQQTLFSESEIIILDSGSNDRTLDLLKKFPVRIFHITPDEFNHGQTRNFGVEQSKGKYVVMTVQDAEAANPYWLQGLVDGFRDERVVGVCGMQIVPNEPSKNPIAWFRPVSPPQTISYTFSNPKMFIDLSPKEKSYICRWDNVNAAYRRDILIALPFKRVDYGEDATWCYEALLGGYSIMYNPHACVYHYHNEDFQYTLKRKLASIFLRYRLFNYVPIRPTFSFKEKLSIIRILLFKSGKLNFSEIKYWWIYNKKRFEASLYAYNLFMEAHKNGDVSLTELYMKFCSAPPIAIKPK